MAKKTRSGNRRNPGRHTGSSGDASATTGGPPRGSERLLFDRIDQILAALPAEEPLPTDDEDLDPDDDDEYAADESGEQPAGAPSPLADGLSVYRFAPSARIVATSSGRGQVACALAQRRPSLAIEVAYLDRALSRHARRAMPPGMENPPRIACRADLPMPPRDEPADAALLPLSATGEAERTRELLQQAHQALREGGVLWVATDNEKDKWLDAEVRKLFDRVSRDANRRGAVYRCVKTGPLKKVKDYRATFAFRDYTLAGGDETSEEPPLLTCISRPGVFAHRRLDLGARALIEGMRIEPGERVLDIGCGSGAVAFAAALRSQTGHVHALDSNPRAAACTAEGAGANGLADRVTTECKTAEEFGGNPAHAGAYDVVLGNPPYYSGYRIAEAFLAAAARALHPEGRLYIVAKKIRWYEDNLLPHFNRATTTEHRGYYVVEAFRTKSDPPPAAT